MTTDTLAPTPAPLADAGPTAHAAPGPATPAPLRLTMASVLRNPASSTLGLIAAAGLTLARGVGYYDRRRRRGCLLGCLAVALYPELDRPGLCSADIKAALRPEPGVFAGLIDRFDARRPRPASWSARPDALGYALGWGWADDLLAQAEAAGLVIPDASEEAEL